MGSSFCLVYIEQECVIQVQPGVNPRSHLIEQGQLIFIPLGP